MINRWALLLVLAIAALVGFPPPEPAHSAASCGAYPFTLTNGTTADANQVMSNFNTVRTCLVTNAAEAGANSSITSLSGLTTPLTVAQGGTGSALGPVLRSYLAGMTASFNTTTSVGISVGFATDSTNAVAISLGSSFFKSISGTWAAGAGTSGAPVNGMGTGLTATLSTWYHICAIVNAAAADVYFDTDAACTANSPAGTTARRRVGSILLNTSTQIISFSCFGNQCLWSTPILDVNAASIGTSAVTPALSVPLGVKTFPLIAAVVLKSGTGPTMYVSSPDVTDIAASPANVNTATNISLTTSAFSTPLFMGTTSLRSNLLSQLRFRTDTASSSYNVATYGWTDDLGRSN